MNLPRRPVALALILAGASLIALALFATPRLSVVEITPTRTGQVERCLTCHQGIEPISAGHSTEEFGCVSCHGGQPLALDADAAHTGMVRNPGAAGEAEKYCAECHTAQVLYVPRAIMSTYAGAIGLVRRAFGLQEGGNALFAVAQVDHLDEFVVGPNDPEPVKQFAERCLTCHVNGEPRHEPYFYRSTGCSTCHVLYADDGLYAGGDPTIPRDEPGHPLQHTFTRQIPYTQCNHCHNRGNYDLRSMDFLPRDDMPPPDGLTGQALRLHEYYQPIGQFTKCEWELECIDCHTAREVMGNGLLQNNRSEVQHIQCKDCHGTLDSPPLSRPVMQATPSAPNPFLSDLALEPDAHLISQWGDVMAHTWRADGQWYLRGKVTGEEYAVPMVQGTACQQKPDEQDSRYCHQCHAYDRAAGP